MGTELFIYWSLTYDCCIQAREKIRLTQKAGLASSLLRLQRGLCLSQNESQL